MPDTTSTAATTTATDPNANSGAAVGVLAPPPADATPEQLVAHWKTEAEKVAGRHSEATNKIREQGEELAKLKPKEPVTTTPPAATSQETPTFVTKQEFEADRLSRQLPPSFQPHVKEIQEYLEKGIDADVALAQVAKKHNIAIGTTTEFNQLGSLPSSGSPGGNRDSSADTRTPDQIESDRKQGITPEMRAKHSPTLQAMWKAKGRG